MDLADWFLCHRFQICLSTNLPIWKLHWPWEFDRIARKTAEHGKEIKAYKIDLHYFYFEYIIDKLRKMFQNMFL